MRFRSELLEDRTVAVNFVFTTCTTVCPALTTTMRAIQRELGDRVGQDVWLISVSVDPTVDRPERLRAFANGFGAGPGWTFVTGEPRDIDRLLKAFGSGVGIRRARHDDADRQRPHRSLDPHQRPRPGRHQRQAHRRRRRERTRRRLLRSIRPELPRCASTALLRRVHRRAVHHQQRSIELQRPHPGPGLEPERQPSLRVRGDDRHLDLQGRLAGHDRRPADRRAP